MIDDLFWVIVFTFGPIWAALLFGLALAFVLDLVDVARSRSRDRAARVAVVGRERGMPEQDQAVVLAFRPQAVDGARHPSPAGSRAHTGHPNLTA